MTQPKPSQRSPFPIAHCHLAIVVNGVLVHAGVINLTAAFLDQLGDDP
jgi:hypothetical protein